MQLIPTWSEALASYKLYNSLSEEKKQLCDKTGVYPASGDPVKKGILNRLANDKKLALGCVQEILETSIRPGKLVHGGTLYGQWYKDDITLGVNLIAEKKYQRLLTRTGILSTIRRWIRIYPDFNLIKIKNIREYPNEIQRLLNFKPRASCLLMLNSDVENVDVLKSIIAKTMTLSQDSESQVSQVTQTGPIKRPWLPEGATFKFGTALSSKLTDTEFAEQATRYLNSILMDPVKENKCHELAKKISNLVGTRFDGELKVFVTGSLKTGLLTKSSDLDLNIPLPTDNPTFNEVETYMKIISNAIRNLGMQKVILLHRRGIRVPLIKFDDPASGVSVDISIGKSTTIFKTLLLLAYTQIDPTVRNLLLFVKSWAAARGINQAVDGTINTYCHSILLLAYLVMVGAIPNLQRICPRHTSFTPFQNLEVASDEGGRCILCNQALADRQYFGFNVYYSSTPIKLTKRLDFIKLLGDFMEFMGHSFQSEKDAISLRLGTLVSRADIGHPLLSVDLSLQQNSAEYKDYLRNIKLLVVEDPFDSSVNVAGSGRPWCMDLLNWEYRRCAYLVKQRQPFSVIMAPFNQPPNHSFISEGIFERHAYYL